MSLKILVINQNVELCGTIGRFLRAEGHLASCCGSDQDWLALLLAERPELIIIEVSMPELAAIEIVKQLHRKATTRHIPVIVISDFPDIELELLHVFDCIGKPVDLGRLREDIDLLVSGARNRGAVIKLPSLTGDEHEKFHDFLIRHCGLHFEKRNQRVLERGLQSRITALRLNSFGEYYDYLRKNMETRQELQKLLQLLTVGETFFFRYGAHFTVLARVLLPQLLGTTPKKRLRIWSAGCSTGEEPYSLAMTIMETIPYWRHADIRIIATDINNTSLKRAREGVYSSWKIRVTEKKYLDKYFKRIGDSYVVRDEVKELVEFSYCNLQSTPLPIRETFDVIFCRNVMIYFTTATTRKVVESFAASLNEGGYLFLGHSETLFSISSEFERHVHENAFYYRKKAVPAEKQTAVSPAATGRRPERPAAVISVPAPAPEISPELLFAKGVSLLHQENFADAAAVFAQLLKRQPDHAGAVLGMGQIHLACNRLDEALSFFNRALQLNDLLPSGYFLRGLFYEMCENESSAVEEYRKAILLQMDFVMPHYQLGKLCFRIGEHKTGLRELKNSLKLLERSGREKIIPFSGGLSREVFIGRLSEEISRVEAAISTEPA